ncbi:chemotaxis protein CheW [Xanthobacteraceae bacterium A53D]
MASARAARHLTVRAGGHRIAIAAEAVAEVIRAPRITRLPNGPSALLGVTHTRGSVLPVISLSGLLGGPVEATADRIVVLGGTQPVGVAVDTVEKIGGAQAAAEAAQGRRLLLQDGESTRWFDLDEALRTYFSSLTTRRAQDATRPVAGAEPASVKAAPEIAFLSFSLDGQPYAILLEAVAEVLNAPASLSPLPQTESTLLGLLERRGNVLPVLALRALLGLPVRPVAPGDAVLVVRIGGKSVGLLVDRINAILRTPPEAVSAAPTLFNRGAGEARIVSVLRRSDGRGLVSILTPDSVLADERVARLIEDVARQEEDHMPDTTSAATRERFLVIRLGGESYGLPIASVDEVARRPGVLTRLPRAPDYVLGVMNLRGKVIPVIDQRQRFSVEGAVEERARRLLVVTIGQLQAAFAVDAVSGIIEVETSHVLPAPELAEGNERLFDRAVPVAGGGEGDVILLIDPQALLARTETDLLRDLTAKIHAP